MVVIISMVLIRHLPYKLFGELIFFLQMNQYYFEIFFSDKQTPFRGSILYKP